MQLRINYLSSFAAGILLTTALCGVAYFSDQDHVQKATAKNSETKTEEKVSLSEKQMKKKLVSSGYIVLSKEDYEKSLEAAKTSESKTPASENQDTPVTRVVVNVAEGMTSIDVGNALVQAKIIENAFNFSKDIESRKLENKLRPGQYVIDSGMTYDQIITTIFR